MNIQILSGFGVIYNEFSQYYENNGSFQVPILNASKYYYEISFFGKYINYNFTLNFQEGSITSYLQNDASSGKDAPKDYPTIINLTENYTSTIGLGYVEDNGLWDDKDSYFLDVPSQGYLNVTTYLKKQITDSFEVEIIQYHSELTFPTRIQPIYHQYVYSDNYLRNSMISINAPIPISGKYIIAYSTSDTKLAYNFTSSFVNASIPLENDFNQHKDLSCYVNGIYSDTQIIINNTYSGQAGPGYMEGINDSFKEDFMDCFVFKLEFNGQLLISFSDIIQPEFDNIPEISSNSMQLDLLDMSLQDPAPYPITSSFDSNNNSFIIKKSLLKGEYGITIYAYKRISYILTLTVFYGKTNTSISGINDNSFTIHTADFPFYSFLIMVLTLPLIKIKKYKGSLK